MLGFVPNFLRHLAQATGPAYPGLKVTSPGYLQMLLQNRSNPRVQVLNDGWDGNEGTFREMKVKYRERGIEDNTQESDTCDLDVIPVYKEADVSLRFFRAVAIGIDQPTLARYEAEALRSVLVGQPATPMMNELLGGIIEQLNGLFQAIDNDLISLQASNFGKNARTGVIVPPDINISKDGTINNLSDGLGLILADLVTNEFSNQTPIIVGSGLFNNYHVQRMANMIGINQAGQNNQNFPYRFFYDRKAATAWGTDDIGVFEPGAVSLLHRNKYKGAFAGEHGTSKFFTITPPIVDQFGMSLAPFTLDAQLRYIDCPTDITVNSYGGTRRFDRGYVLTVSAYFDQFNIPGDAYNSSDPLYGTNGTLWYNITNECETC